MIQSDHIYIFSCRLYDSLIQRHWTCCLTGIIESLKRKLSRVKKKLFVISVRTKFLWLKSINTRLYYIFSTLTKIVIYLVVVTFLRNTHINKFSYMKDKKAVLLCFKPRRYSLDRHMAIDHNIIYDSILFGVSRTSSKLFC